MQRFNWIAKTCSNQLICMLAVLVLMSACGQNQQQVDNSALYDIQTQSARNNTTLNAQSTQISQNIATLDAQALQIEERIEIMSLQATLEYQNAIIDEQSRLNRHQAAQIERISQPNWPAIILSLAIGPSLGIALIYALKKMKYAKNQAMSPFIQVSSENMSVKTGEELAPLSVSTLNHTEIEKVTAEEHQLPVEQTNSEIKSVNQSNLEETTIEHTEVYTRHKKVVHREFERNDLTIFSTGEEKQDTDEIKIDFDQVDTLSRDSESIRDRLIGSAHYENEGNADDASHPNTITELSTNDLSAILQSEEFRSILLTMWQSDWKVSRRQLEAKLPNKFLNVILDELNGQTIELMGDNLIYDDNGILLVTEEFQSLVTKYFSSDYSGKSGK